MSDEPGDRDHAGDNAESGRKIASYRANREHLPILGMRSAQPVR
jgi:hypothetical protein